MDDIVIPYWCIESVLLLLCMAALVAAIIFVLIECVRWISSGIRNGIDATKLCVFLMLVAVSAFPGFVYHKMNYCWVAILFKLPESPSYDMLSAAMAVQKTVIAYTMRTLSIAVMYAISYFVIRKDRIRHQ